MKAKNPPTKNQPQTFWRPDWRASASRWLIVCGLLYFFIAPILGLVWALLNLPADLARADEIRFDRGCLHRFAFVLVSKNWDMFRRKHFTLGIVTQFLYVAAQTGIFSFLRQLHSGKRSRRDQNAGLPLAGRNWLCPVHCWPSLRQRRHQPVQATSVLAAYAAINVVLTAVCMGGGKLGMYAMFGTFFFMSVMFPTIFALGIRGLGDHTKLGSSLIVMSIVGGAIAAPFMGHIADAHSMRIGFVVPLVCFVLIALYGVVWQKLEAKDSAA